MADRIELFINFNGNCEEAVNFYADVFGSDVDGLMRFGEMEPDSSFPIPDEFKDKLMYAGLNVFNTRLMFSDVPPGMPFVQGNNISPTLISSDQAELKRIFERFAEAGQVTMGLQQTFWSALYGIVVDKYGVVWQVSHEGSDASKF